MFCGRSLRDGEEAVRKVGELHPDIVLLDIQMPRMNGIQAARQIHQLEPSTKIVFLTGHPQSVFDESTMFSNGFVSKLSAETELIPILNHLLQSTPDELKEPLRYQLALALCSTWMRLRQMVSRRLKKPLLLERR